MPNDARWEQPLAVEPGTFYTVFGFTRGSDIAPPGAMGANISIVGGFDASDGYSGTFDWTQVGMTFTGPESGSAVLSVRLGFYGSVVTGKAWFDRLDIHPIPRIEGSHLYLALEPADVAQVTPTVVTGWLAELDQAYEAYQDLVGSVPYGGAKIGVLSVQQYPGGWAVAGNPIRWQARYVPDQLADVRDKGDWSFGILHEIGHDFDVGAWNWNGEFFANFKMFYVVDTLGATVGAGGIVANAEQLEAFYKSSYDATFPQGQFAYDALTYCFIRIVDAVGWEPFRQTFRYFVDSGVNPATKLEQFELFLDKLTEYSGVDVRATFLPGELAVAEAGIAADGG